MNYYKVSELLVNFLDVDCHQREIGCTVERYKLMGYRLEFINPKQTKQGRSKGKTFFKHRHIIRFSKELPVELLTGRKSS